MIEYRVQFEEEGPDVVRLPLRRFVDGVYKVVADRDGGVEVFGNRDGLLFLAEVIVRCAMGGFSDGFHVHLPREGVAQQPDTSGGAELTVYAAGTPPLEG